MGPPQHWFHHKGFLLFFFFLIVNLLLLDLWVGINFNKTLHNQPSTMATKVTPSATPLSDNQLCPKNCLTIIDEATTSLKLAPQAKVSPSTPKVAIPSPDTSTVKEFFIPLGTGTSTAEDWTDVPGVKAEVDNTKYGKIQKILFEASVHVPSANEIVEVRLYNESDKHPVWNSELFFPSATTQNFRIAEIQLGQGAKTYKVQMKTQLKFPANLDQARIHITTF